MKKIIKLTEHQLKLYTNLLDEAFTFKTDKNTGNRIMSYKPGENSKIDDTIFNEDKSLKVRKIKLPKSGVISYNLYDIKHMDVNKALKHGVDIANNKVERDKSVEIFINRSVLLIKHIIGNNPVDIITYPQSSSNFNKEITSKLLSHFPNSEGILLKPELLTKNVRGITVNDDIARSVGLTDEEISFLKRRVEKWKKEEDIRDIRRKIEGMVDEIQKFISQRSGGGRGRLPKQYNDMKQQVSQYRDEINNLRKGMIGRDPTINTKTGHVKDWQIKSIDDKDRKAIENIFQLNPMYENYRNKLINKHVIVFDDNISSGATLDEVCVTLKKLGVASVIPFTLGTIMPTMYNPQDRNQYKMEHGLEPKTHRLKKEKPEPPYTDVDGQYHVGYKIIKMREGGFNLMDKSGKMIFTSKPPLEIEYNPKNRLFYVKTDKFSYKGRPGSWKKIN